MGCKKAANLEFVLPVSDYLFKNDVLATEFNLKFEIVRSHIENVQHFTTFQKMRRMTGLWPFGWLDEKKGVCAGSSK